MFSQICWVLVWRKSMEGSSLDTPACVTSAQGMSTSWWTTGWKSPLLQTHQARYRYVNGDTLWNASIKFASPHILYMVCKDLSGSFHLLRLYVSQNGNHQDIYQADSNITYLIGVVRGCERDNFQFVWMGPACVCGWPKQVRESRKGSVLGHFTLLIRSLYSLLLLFNLLWLWLTQYISRTIQYTWHLSDNSGCFACP